MRSRVRDRPGGAWIFAGGTGGMGGALYCMNISNVALAAVSNDIGSFGGLYVGVGTPDDIGSMNF